MNYSTIISENQTRLSTQRGIYNPLTGEGSDSCVRKLVEISDAPLSKMWLPEAMLNIVLISEIAKVGSLKEFILHQNLSYSTEAVNLIWEEIDNIRCRFDFEYWAYTRVVIKDKITSQDIPFFLNRGQRKLLRELYTLWLARKPIRIILLKARQWGGSTLVQIFMSWIQLVHHTQWNSVICAHVENTAKIIRGMYSKMLRNYPYHKVGAKEALKLVPFEHSQKTRVIEERGCRITIGSAEKPDGVRGDDVVMAHLSEVGLWGATQGKKPEDLVQTIISGISEIPDSLIVYESTAKGVGNFFHREWLRAKKGESGFVPVFVAWFEIDMYRANIKNYKKFIDTLKDSEWELWKAGATLENIAWYRNKKKAYSEDWRFVSEYPSNDIEAFQSTGNRFFPQQHVNKLRETCVDPIFVGDIQANETYGAEALIGIRFVEKQEGNLKVWQFPELEEKMTDRYVVVVDVSYGLSDSADKGIIGVFDRYWMHEPGGVPEVVAQWGGGKNIPTHYLIWKATQLATLYGNALLVIESNTTETRQTAGFEFEAVLDEIAHYYNNLYYRTTVDKLRNTVIKKYGFHMGTSSKFLVCSHQQKVIETGMYIERDLGTCDEHDTFEVKENGSLGAVEGCHDDKLIVRAVGVWVCYKIAPPKFIEDIVKKPISKRIINESSF